MMANVALEAESHITNKHKDFEITFTENYVVDKKVIARSALMIADDVQADYILLFTNSGFLARIVSGFKPNHRVFAFTKDESVVKSMNILFGVYPFLIGEWSTYPIQDEKKALEILLEKKMISSGNKIVIINDVIEGNATFPYVKIVIV
jgi:pyruvate kinase